MTQFVKTKEYSELSKNLTKSLNKISKKQNGIYFTPPSIISQNIDIIKKFSSNIQTILEPACGSCEYITQLREHFPNSIIHGIENNETIYNSIKYMNDNKTQLIHGDYLKHNDTKEYDLIIGNPPFYVMKKDLSDDYHQYYNGRPNIFIPFIVKSMKKLKLNGILSFVLPKNFLNCSYYNETREYLNKFKILDIIECPPGEYIETKQDTIIIIVQNKTVKTNTRFSLKKNKYTLFGKPNNIKEIKELYKESTCLGIMNFDVKVGNVVWNQCKHILTDDDTKTRLIYNSDIVEKQLVNKKYKNPLKKNYIDRDGIMTPIMVLNRGYRAGDYAFEYCIIKGGFPYLIENHLICIKYTSIINYFDLLELYSKIATSFEDPRTKRFIELYFGNNAINTTELKYILPIYY